VVNIGGDCIPVGDIRHRFNEIPRDGQVILYCRSGQRSQQALAFLQLEKGYTNVYHLRGGIRAYMTETR
jgi:rhodanese-related sulfurtransferase